MTLTFALNFYSLFPNKCLDVPKTTAISIPDIPEPDPRSPPNDGGYCRDRNKHRNLPALLAGRPLIYSNE